MILLIISIIIFLLSLPYFIFTLFRERYGKYFLKKGFKKYSQREDIDEKYIDKNTGDEKKYLLRDFYIASSYKPYQLLGNDNDICSYDAIKLSIQKGARFHFIDIWPSEKNIPVVRNETILKNTKPLNFNKVCQIYSLESWKNNVHDPLILYLNIHYNDNDKYK